MVTSSAPPMAVTRNPGTQASTHVITYLKFAGLGLLIVALYWQVLPSMILDWWTEEGYSYGFLVPPLAFYIAWQQRARIAAVPARPDMRGLILIAGACLAFLAGKLGVEDFLSRISLVILLAGLVWTFWGFDRLRSLAFPFVLLATMVPLPTVVYYRVTAPAQLIASSLACSTVQLLGGYIYRDGNILHLAGTTLGVAEACSGLRNGLSLLVSALLVGQLACSRLISRVILFGLAIPLAILINVVRITATAMIADYSPELSQGFYHLFSGWLVFMAGLGALFMVAKGLRFSFEKGPPAGIP